MESSRPLPKRTLIELPTQPHEVPWPTEQWPTASPAEVGADSERLAQLLDELIGDAADTDRLGLGRPDVEPKVTESIPEIVELISSLIDRDLAYAADGDVYFSVAAFPSYGRLSGQRVAELLEEGRVEPGAGKRDPADFALWKARRPEQDSWWASPFGDGRPGWHIECSAMSHAHLGDDFDVHGGGLDLIFPHHENERAQSEGATGGRFCRTWMHNGMLRFGGSKMSKSLGNVETLSDALDRDGAETLLMLFARGHYRSPLDYTETSIAEARRACDRFREALRGAARLLVGRRGGDDEEGALADAADAAGVAFDAALDDDLATPGALAALYDLARALNTATSDGVANLADIAVARATLVSRLAVLGLAGLGDAEGAGQEIPSDVISWAEERQRARELRDFARADELRDRIAAAGFSSRDTPDGYELTRT